MGGEVGGDESCGDAGGDVAGVVGAEGDPCDGDEPGHRDHEPAEAGVPGGEHRGGNDGKDRVARRHRPELGDAFLPECPGVGDDETLPGGNRVHAEGAEEHVGLAQHGAGAADEHFQAERQEGGDADRDEPVEQAAAVVGVEQPDREDDDECHTPLAELLEDFKLAADIASDGERASGAAGGDDAHHPRVDLPEQDAGDQAV